MRQSLVLGAFATGAASLMIASCNGESDMTTGVGGTGGTGSAADSIAASTGTVGNGIGFCDQGIDVDLGSSTKGELTATGQQDFYRFTGKKGQVLMIDIDAQTLESAEYDQTYIDSVVTLFNAGGLQIAQNNDPIEYASGDSRLYTILPADGEYCARVAECWTVIPNPVLNCVGKKDKVGTTYSIGFYEFADHPGDSYTAEGENGDNAASATTIEYQKGSEKIYTTTFWGTFRDQNDVDVFNFTMPMDLPPPPSMGVRTTGRFYFTQWGPNQSGATAPTGKVTIVDPSEPGVAIAEIHATKNPWFYPPLDVGKPYQLLVTRAQGAIGANDFYFVRHYPSWSNPLEKEKGTGANDTPEKAETLPLTKDQAFVEGYLSPAGQDIDHFALIVPQYMKYVGAVCAAQRVGSGLRGLSMSLKSEGSSPAVDVNAVETETDSCSVPRQKIGDKATVIVKIEAASQAPLIKSDFYLCRIYFEQ